MLNTYFTTSSAFSNENPAIGNSGQPELKCLWVDQEYLEKNVATWNRLVDSAIAKSVALEPNYLLPAIKHLAGPDVRVLAVELNCGGESLLVGLVPVVEKPIYRLPFKSVGIWKHAQSFDATPLLHKDHAVGAWKAICETVLSSGYTLFSLDTVSAAAPFDAVLQEVELSEGQFRFQRDSFDRAAFSPCSSSEAYVEQFVTKKTLSNTRRLMRSLEKLGEVTWETSTPESDYEFLAKRFLSIEASGWKGKKGTALASKPSTREFFLSMIEKSSRLGKVRFLTLLLDKKPIAMICNTQSDKFVYSYKTAFDESYAKYSPGIQVEIKNLENFHRDGIQASDTCCAPDNQAMNRIYGQRASFQNLVVSLKPGLARLSAKALPAFQNAVRKFNTRVYETVDYTQKSKLVNSILEASLSTTPNMIQIRCNPESHTMNLLAPTLIELGNTKVVEDHVPQGRLSDRQNNQDETLDQMPQLIESSVDQGEQFTIRVVQSTDEFAELQTAWNKLTENPLQSFDWHFAWWQHFGGDHELQIYCLESKGEVVGIAPFFKDRWLGQNRLRFIGSGSACTDYADVIVDRNYRHTFINAIVNQTQRFADVDLIELEGVDNRGPVKAFAAECSDEAWEYQKTIDACWYLTLPDSWEKFCKAARSSLRRKIRKAEKRIKSGEVVIRSTDDDLDFETAYKTLVELHQLRFESKGEPGVFADPAFDSFLKQSAEKLCRQQRAEIIVAYADSKPIGCHFYLLSDSGPQFYQGGVLISRMDLEPGHLMFTYAIKKAIANGAQEFDFLRGDEKYKPFWGAVARELYSARIVSKKLKPTLTNMAYLYARRSKHLMVGVASKLRKSN